jgi:chitin disaccharide deacetylase
LAASMHPVVLCGDDFGMTEGVSQGILDLARQGRLSATSAMVNGRWWPRFAPALREFEGRLGVGLHLNLTLGEPLGAMPRLAPRGIFPSLSDVLRKGLLGQFPGDEIGAEIERQLSAFEAVLGRPPDFVDGHQHVHVLPGVRAGLLRALQDRGWSGRVWLRDPSDRLGAILRRRVAAQKALTVRALASGFAGQARASGFFVNKGFSGFSPFDPARDVAADFAMFFDDLGPQPVVMCHPGHADEELRALDPVVEMREREYAYLAANEFLRLLDRREVSLVPSPSSGR